MKESNKAIFLNHITDAGLFPVFSIFYMIFRFCPVRVISNKNLEYIKVYPVIKDRKLGGFSIYFGQMRGWGGANITSKHKIEANC